MFFSESKLLATCEFGAAGIKIEKAAERRVLPFSFFIPSVRQVRHLCASWERLQRIVGCTPVLPRTSQAPAPLLPVSQFQVRGQWFISINFSSSFFLQPTCFSSTCLLFLGVQLAHFDCILSNIVRIPRWWKRSRLEKQLWVLFYRDNWTGKVRMGFF